MSFDGSPIKLLIYTYNTWSVLQREDTLYYCGGIKRLYIVFVVWSRSTGFVRLCLFDNTCFLQIRWQQ